MHRAPPAGPVQTAGAPLPSPGPTASRLGGGAKCTRCPARGSAPFPLPLPPRREPSAEPALPPALPSKQTCMGTLLTTSPALPPPGARSEPPSHPCPGLLQGPHSFQHGRTHALPTACSPHTGHDPLKANSCSEPSLAPHLTRAAAPATPSLRRGPHGKLLATSGPCARPRTCPSLRVECCSPQMCACAHTHFI